MLYCVCKVMYGMVFYVLLLHYMYWLFWGLSQIYYWWCLKHSSLHPSHASLSERCDRHLCLFIYKALIGKLPSFITSLLGWCSGPSLILSNDWLSLQVPWACSELGRSAFSFLDYLTSLQSTLKWILSASVCTCFNWIFLCLVFF